MIKVLIISDTHHNNIFLQKVLANNQDCQYLIHLGDEPDDLENFPELISEMLIYSVFGIYHQSWRRENAVMDFKINLNNDTSINFHIAHVKEHHTLHSDNDGLNIYCFGHTHHRYFEKFNNDKSVFINPGHLKKEIDRGEIAGYAILQYDENLNKTELIFRDFKSNELERYCL